MENTIKDLINKGDFSCDIGRPKQALEYYRQALEECEKRVKEDNSIEAKNELFDVLNSMSRVYWMQQELESALKCCIQMLEVKKELEKESDSVDDKRESALILNNMGFIDEQLKNDENALSNYKEAEKYLEPIVEEYQIPNDVEVLKLIKERIAELKKNN